ncbi:MAG TPA: winged helix-turn-helix transcriptional regulator [Candidatus Binatia bacterium]|nr:winged helix-turn-helix transcriptional regulator [Candidatus Binatia bacterium]
MRSSRDPKEILELDVRRRIFDIVRSFAGCHLREIQRSARLSFGSASYHLSYLEKHHLIKAEKYGKHVRYFSQDVSADDGQLLSLLRQKSVRSILVFLVLHEGCTHQEIVSALGLSASTITWHVKKLLDARIVAVRTRGKFNSYSLIVPKERIMTLLISYKESFLDKLVDGLIDAWER